MNFIYHKIIEILKSNHKTALCTITLTRGSTPLKAGAKMIVFEDGSICGTIGGGPLEKKTIEDALAVIHEKKSKLIKHDLNAQLQMCCGGIVEIFIEPIMQKKKLFIFGAGHVGKAIVKHSLDLDFDITVIDPREDVFYDWEFSGYNKVISEFAKAMPTLTYDKDTFIIVTTFDHATDREVLAFCMKKPYYYLGMIGSKNKVNRTHEIFISENIATKEELEKVDMPVGLNIHAVSADEIAISIVAKIIMEKNK